MRTQINSWEHTQMQFSLDQTQNPKQKKQNHSWEQQQAEQKQGEQGQEQGEREHSEQASWATEEGHKQEDNKGSRQERKKRRTRKAKDSSTKTKNQSKKEARTDSLAASATAATFVTAAPACFADAEVFPWFCVHDPHQPPAAGQLWTEQDINREKKKGEERRDKWEFQAQNRTRRISERETKASSSCLLCFLSWTMSFLPFILPFFPFFCLVLTQLFASLYWQGLSISKTSKHYQQEETPETNAKH